MLKTFLRLFFLEKWYGICYLLEQHQFLVSDNFAQHLSSSPAVPVAGFECAAALCWGEPQNAEEASEKNLRSGLCKWKYKKSLWGCPSKLDTQTINLAASLHTAQQAGKEPHGCAILHGPICLSLEISNTYFECHKHIWVALLRLDLTRFSEVSLLTSSRMPSFMSFSSRNNFCRWLISWLRCSTLKFKPSISFSYISFWDWKWLSNTLLKQKGERTWQM